MGISRQRGKKSSVNSKYIIHSQRHILKEALVYLVDLIMWLYIIIVMSVFISAIIDTNTEELRVLKAILKVTNEDLNQFILVSLAWFVASMTVLSMWKFYNFKRYGKLHRRKEPMPTTQQEMLELGLIDPEVYKQLQNNRVIALETNPIKNLVEEKAYLNE